MKPKVRHLAAEPVIAVRHSPKRHRYWLRYTVSLLMASVLVFMTSGLAIAYYQLQGNIKTGDANQLLNAANRPKRVGAAPLPNDPFTGRALNIVLIGSDTRSGDNQSIGGGDVGGMRSDTTILAHISKDRTRADLVSFPRDMMVSVPACQRSDGSSSGPGYMQFNAAFAYGGMDGDVTSAAACTIAAIETLTNIRVDGFVVVDMAGFENVINAIGGVSMCIPQAINAPKANLRIAAGYQHLSGATALKYARARTGEGLGGEGSDLKRIERQQKLMGAVARTILSSEVLTSMPKMYGVLDAITKSVTMTKEYANLQTLAGLGISLRSLNKDSISFITVPNGPYPADPNRVIPSEPRATELFDALRNDEPVEGTIPWKKLHPATAAPTPDATNGTGTQGTGTMGTGALGTGGAETQGTGTQGGSGAGTSPTPTPGATVNSDGLSGVVGTASSGLSQATEDNPFAAKSGGVDVDVCAGQG